jgi:hypothetical protein
MTTLDFLKSLEKENTDIEIDDHESYQEQFIPSRNEI